MKHFHLMEHHRAPASRHALRNIAVALTISGLVAREEQAHQRELSAARKKQHDAAAKKKGAHQETVTECIKAAKEGQRNGSVPKKNNVVAACGANPGMAAP